MMCGSFFKFREQAEVALYGFQTYAVFLVRRASRTKRVPEASRNLAALKACIEAAMVSVGRDSQPTTAADVAPRLNAVIRVGGGHHLTNFF